MPYYDDWNFGAEDDPEYRRRALENKLLKPLGLTLNGPEKLPGPDAAESPASIERKRQQAADRLLAHDRLFEIDPAHDTDEAKARRLGLPYFKQTPRFTAGDDGANE